MVLALFIVLLLGLWAASIFWLTKWAKFWIFFLANLLLMMTYTAWVTVGRLTLPGTDPYGLRKLFLLAVLMTGHTLAGFIFALLQRSRLKKHQRLIEGLKKKTHTQ